MEKAKQFLLAHWDGKSPLLLGYSGGPDSKALLYALLEAGCRALHVAHVDHGWRKESAQEAEELRAEIEGLGLPFHTTRLSAQPERNMEALAREERLRYFRSLFEEVPYQALLLGHQADDLAETALKRLFEGAHLPFLGGMDAVTQIGTLPLWRPLLKVRRQEILDFLDKRDLRPLLDPTNEDPLYLRARMRRETLPLLNRSFGKRVENNLILLSERAYELKAYLDQKIAQCRVERGEWGVSAHVEGLERIEARHLIQKIAQGEGMVLPRTLLEPLLDGIAFPSAPRKVFFQKKWIVSQKGWVFFLPSDVRKALPEKGLVRKLLNSFIVKRSNPNL